MVVKEMVTCPDCGKEGIKNLKMHIPYCKAQVAKATEVVADDRMPGAHIMDGKGRKVGKVPWTLKDCDERDGTIEYMPLVTTPVTVNGVRIQCIRNVSQLMPKMHYEALRNYERKIGRKPDFSDVSGIPIDHLGSNDISPGAEEE